MFGTRSWRRAAAVGLLAGMLGACGGGGGDEGGSVPPVPIADSAALWWNAEPAARWAYEVTDSRPNYPARRVNLVTVDGTVTVDGKTFTRFAHSSSIADAQPEEELRYFDGSSVFVAGDVSLDPSVPLVGSYAELPAPLVSGVITTVLDESEDFDVDGDGRADFRLRLLVTVLLGTEASRSVPAGSFSNVLWARTAATATVTELTLNQSESATAIQTVWYAPGVGPIRRELIDPDPALGATNNFVVEELSGVSTAAVRAGKVPGFMALDAIGAGTDSGIAGIPAMASDGNGVLVVSGANTASGVTLQGAILAADGSRSWNGTVISDGTSGSSSLLSAATFDGANYQAFWARPSDGALVGQRVSTAGALLGPLAGTPVGPAVGSGTLGRIAAASNGTDVLLVWQRFVGGAWVTEGQLVNRNGENVPGGSFSLPTGEADIAVARLGPDFLVARASPSGSAVSFVRVGSTGTLVGSDWIALAGSGPYATDPRVTPHPDGVLVGWTSWASPPNAGIDNRILSRRIRFDGLQLDATDVAIDANPVTDRFGFALTGSTQGLFAGWVRDLTLDAMQTADRARAARAPWAPGAPSFGAPGSYWYTTPALQPPPDAYPVAVAAGDRFVMAWLENLQTAATPSDRVVATIVYPPAAR